MNKPIMTPSDKLRILKELAIALRYEFRPEGVLLHPSHVSRSRRFIEIPVDASTKEQIQVIYSVLTIDPKLALFELDLTQRTAVWQNAHQENPE